MPPKQSLRTRAFTRITSSLLPCIELIQADTVPSEMPLVQVLQFGVDQADELAGLFVCHLSLRQPCNARIGGVKPVSDDLACH